MISVQPAYCCDYLEIVIERTTRTHRCRSHGQAHSLGGGWARRSSTGGAFQKALEDYEEAQALAVCLLGTLLASCALQPVALSVLVNRAEGADWRTLDVRM
jgi:hypothetical protein